MEKQTANKNSQERDAIVLEMMYNGKYLSSASNIGYEIINTYKADDDNDYVYLLPLGNFAKNHQNRIKYVLFVRKVEKKPLLEVLGKAEIEEDLYICGDKNSIELAQNELKKKIKYGKKSIECIFQNCKCQEVVVTFKSKRTLRAKEERYIYFKEDGKKELNCLKNVHDYCIIKGAKIRSRSQKRYFYPNENTESYTNLMKFIEDPKNWKEEELPKIDKNSLKEEEEKMKKEKGKENFFEICGIEDREFSFSNALAYYIEKYPKLYKEFLELQNKKYKGCIEGKVRAVREEANIDLLIKSDKFVTIIENKIRSGINGLDKNVGQEFSQLEIYYNHIETVKDKDHKLIYGDCEKLYVVLMPDYSNIDITKYTHGDKYKVVRYSEVYNFLSEKLQQEPYSNDFLFSQFVDAMEKHTKERYEDLFEVIDGKFKRMIIKAKKNSN